LFQDSFVYNYYYSAGGYRNLLNVIYYGFRLLSNSTYLYIFVILAGIDIFVYLFYLQKRPYLKNISPYLWLMLIVLPIEFFLSSTSGKLADHYYLPWLPIMSLFVGYLIYILQNSKKNLVLSSLFIFLLGVFLTYKIIDIPVKADSYLSNFSFSEDKVIEYIKNTTQPEDYVFTWGVGQHIAVAADRKSPTKYIYQSPLYIPGFQKEEMYSTLLSELANKKPVLIIDGNTSQSKFKPIDCDKPQVLDEYAPSFRALPQVNLLVSFICANYSLEKQTYNEWRVYRLKSLN
jgi:hypothetical protein